MADSIQDGNQVTIIITTSPIPSNPSTNMISQVLDSMSRSPYLSTCPVIVVFDGFTLNENTQFKSSKISEKQALAYEEYRISLQQLLSAQVSLSSEAPPVLEKYTEVIGLHAKSTVTRAVFSRKLQTLSQSVRVGFALAIHSALVHVTTPYVLIVQHDWAFTRAVPIESLLQTLNHDPEVNYIGFVSRQTLDYVNRKTNRAPLIPAEILLKNEQPFARLFFWYDKPHLARTDYYRTTVFGHKRFKRGDFIEDTFGHTVLTDSKRCGLEGWRKYGCWLWYPDEGLLPTIRHLNGRKFYDVPGYWTKNEEGEWYYKARSLS